MDDVSLLDSDWAEVEDGVHVARGSMVEIAAVHGDDGPALRGSCSGMRLAYPIG